MYVNFGFIIQIGIVVQIMGLFSSKILSKMGPGAIWGIKMSSTDLRATDKTQWQGLNLLGTLLTRLRDEYIAYIQDSI